MTESMLQPFREGNMAHIKNEEQYKAMMARIDQLFFETNEKTPADDPRLMELDLLSSLVEEYEKEHFPIETPSLAKTLNERLADNEWTQKEMAGRLGMTAARLNAILSGKANPTYEQARTISESLKIDPAIVLAL
ncbi:MAG: helix-turn-helix domain-containing protein [Bacteroidales bacterium]|nr:helix-turn-helix domain-containing protein [Bacteroidales bacterium]